MAPSGKKAKARKVSKSSGKTKSLFNLNNIFRILSVLLFLVSQFRMFRGEWADSVAPFVGALVLGISFFVDFTRLDRWDIFTPEKRGNFSHWEVAVLFFVYIVVMMWKALTHPDMVITGYDMTFFYPFKCYWVKSIQEGDPALWNPYYHLGIPYLFSWPDVAIGSPFNLLSFIFPQTYAMTLQVFGHFFLSAFGTYLLVRLLGAGWKGGVLSGSAFSFGGFYLAHTHQGQIWLWFAASWAPWMVWSVEKFMREKKIFWVAMLALFCALSYFEGFPQITEYSMLIMAFYSLGALLFRGMSFKAFLCVAFGSLCFLFLTAFTLIPEVEYGTHTNRWTWHYSDIMENYVAPDSLKILVDPLFGSPKDPTGAKTRSSYHETANYIGYVPLALFAAGCFFFRKVPRVFWTTIMAFFFGLMAMGASNPISRAIFDLFYDYVPGFSHHRSIGRLVVIPCFFMCCSAGLMLGAAERWLNSFSKGKWGWLPLLALGLTVLDLQYYDHGFIGVNKPDEFVSQETMFSDAVMKKILADPTYPRIQPRNDIAASLSYKLAQVQVWEETLPDNMARYIQDTHDNWDSPLSDLISLKYLYAEPYFAHPTPRWQRLMDNTVYNTKALPRAFVVGGYHLFKSSEKEDVAMIHDGDVDCGKEVILYEPPKGLAASQPGFLGEAKITHYGNNAVDMECSTSKPGILFLSDTYFMGWKAWVDGQGTEIMRANRAFRAVVIPQAGTHRIRMEYHPDSVKIGGIISLAGWGLWAWVVFRRRKTTIA
jgi:hypothetical protein